MFSKADVLSLGLPDRPSSAWFVRPRKNIFCHSYTRVLLIHPAPYNAFTSCRISFPILLCAVKTRIVLRTSTSVNVASSSILTGVYFWSSWRYQLEIFTVCPRTQKLNLPIVMLRMFSRYFWNTPRRTWNIFLNFPQTCLKVPLFILYNLQILIK